MIFFLELFDYVHCNPNNNAWFIYQETVGLIEDMVYLYTLKHIYYLENDLFLSKHLCFSADGCDMHIVVW